MIRRSLIALAVSAICAPRGVLAGLLPADGTPFRYVPDELAEDGYPRYGLVPIDVYEKRVATAEARRRVIVHQDARSITFAGATGCCEPVSRPGDNL